ncbi:uncharacterized protein FA14DRAFT_185910 [Meira miltonrushii]|uniref:Uncharacterized protein n=1 Tax=Meira miltonrushii TaxID=1280837 RepID=A0A316V372_9BASI|nr:uncharacterized protein FA14DRAFT_185910 [Meira miltonrushii]PWN32006.1 hypothetical protein FA14DRAFT_185910 [Meira miltonrushii]
MLCIPHLYYLLFTLFFLVPCLKAVPTGSSPSRAASHSNGNSTSNGHEITKTGSGGRSHEVPDLNEMAAEESDHNSPPSTRKEVSSSADTSKESKMALRERLREESRKRKNKRRTEKRESATTEHKEELRMQGSIRQLKYRTNLKQKTGFPSVQLKRYHELKSLKEEGKASDQQIQELSEYIRRTRKIGKESKARI